MKKFLPFALSALVLFTSCGDMTELQEENEALKTELEGYKNGDIQDVTVEGEELVITFTNGAVYRTTAPESMTGDVSNMSFDETTGMLTLTMKDGNVYTFHLGHSTAVLTSDTNGKYAVSAVKMGDVPLFTIDYNADNLPTHITTYETNGYEVMKVVEMEKVYEGGTQPTGIYTREYATETGAKFEYLGYGSASSTTVEHTEDLGQYNYFSNGDGTYTIERYSYSYYDDVTQQYIYVYNQYASGYVTTSSSWMWDMPNYHYIKTGPQTFNKTYYDTDYWDSDAQQYVYLYYGYYDIVKVTGSYEVGDVMMTEYNEIVYNSNGQVAEIYSAAAEGLEPTEYQKNTYDTNGLLTKTENFYKVDGNWKSDGYLTFTYEGDKLVSTTGNDGVESKEVQKVDYDEAGNPVALYVHMEEETEENYVYNSTTDDFEFQTTTTVEAGMHRVAEFEYKDNMKNFLGNTTDLLFPELKGLKINNALSGAVLSNNYSYGSLEYTDFNEGGYPERIIGFGAGGDDIDESGRIELTLEYKKIAE